MSRIKGIIESGILKNSMLEENTVNSTLSNREIMEYQDDFAERQSKVDFGEKKDMTRFEVPEYTDEDVFNFPSR